MGFPNTQSRRYFLNHDKFEPAIGEWWSSRFTYNTHQHNGWKSFQKVSFWNIQAQILIWMQEVIKGWTAFMLSCKNGHNEVIQLKKIQMRQFWWFLNTVRKSRRTISFNASMRPMPNNENFPSKIFNFSLDIAAAPQNINYGCVSIVTKFQNFALVVLETWKGRKLCMPTAQCDDSSVIF